MVSSARLEVQIAAKFKISKRRKSLENPVLSQKNDNIDLSVYNIPF